MKTFGTRLHSHTGFIVKPPRSIKLDRPLIKLEDGKWKVFTPPFNAVNTVLTYKAWSYARERNWKEGRYS